MVIVERKREELAELSVRVVRYLAGKLHLATALEASEPSVVPISEAIIIGIITPAVQVFQAVSSAGRRARSYIRRCSLEIVLAVAVEKSRPRFPAQASSSGSRQ